MRWRRTPTLALPLEYDPSDAYDKALVRLAQTLSHREPRLFALRAGGAIFRVGGFATLSFGAGAGLLLWRSSSTELLGVRPTYLAGAAVAGAVVVAVPQFVIAGLLSLRVAMARQAELLSVVLAELGVAVAGESARAQAASAPAVKPVPTQAPAPSAPAAPRPVAPSSSDRRARRRHAAR